MTTGNLMLLPTSENGEEEPQEEEQEEHVEVQQLSCRRPLSAVFSAVDSQPSKKIRKNIDSVVAGLVKKTEEVEEKRLTMKNCRP
ncbi:unnamed protein product [Rhizopus stolonifer]